MFTIRIEGKQEMRYLDFRDMGRIYWVGDLDREVPGWTEVGPEADSVTEMGIEAFRKRLRRFRDELKDLLRNRSSWRASATPTQTRSCSRRSCCRSVGGRR